MQRLVVARFVAILVTIMVVGMGCAAGGPGWTFAPSGAPAASGATAAAASTSPTAGMPGMSDMPGMGSSTASSSPATAAERRCGRFHA